MKKTKRRLMEVASKLWLPTHRPYRQLCVLAVTGQLGGGQICELNKHIASCESCRKFLESVVQVGVQLMPLVAEKHAAADVVPPDGMRARFLSRVAAEVFPAETGAGLAPSPGLEKQTSVIEKQTSVIPIRGATEQQEVGPGLSSARHSWVWGLRWPAAALAACGIFTFAGFYLGERRPVTPATQTASRVKPIPQGEGSGEGFDRVSQLERQKSQLEAKLAELKERLFGAKSHMHALDEQLATADNKLASLAAQSEGDRRRFLHESQEASNEVAILRDEVDGLRKQLADTQATLLAQQQATEEVMAKLEATKAELQRERDLKSAKMELGDLVAARNLHIVDVYDAEPNGKRQRAFGRVFYIQGKSLVFYAYDLDAPGRFKANVVFHVWGGKAGVKEVTHSLGILHKDDGGQGRWSMTFDDSNVLAQINSVFVTAEPANRHYDQPHGKKVLYAYFGSPPNHP